MPITVRPLPSLLPNDPQSHHIGTPPTGFRNPWPSFTETHHGLLSVLKVRFAKGRPAFVPVPSDRSELVPVHKIDFAALQSDSDPGYMKVTWIGHASFLIQTTCPPETSTIPTTTTTPPPPTTPPPTTTSTTTTLPSSSDSNRLLPRVSGINILCDPVFSDRTSPVSWLGPKRYTPPPCSLSELLDNIEIDIVLISHNHYDHADTPTLRSIWARRKQNVRFIAGLHNARWLVSACGIDRACIIELDWWDRVEIEVEFDFEVDEPPATSAAAGLRQEATAVVGGVQSETSPSNPGKGNETATTSPESMPQTKAKADNNTITPSSMEARNLNSARARVQITCTPTQHFSSRSVFDRNHDLWCSYTIEDCSGNHNQTSSSSSPLGESVGGGHGPKIYFAGDTAYRTVGVPTTTTTTTTTSNDISVSRPRDVPVADENKSETPVCPAFKQIGDLVGPFDLALLPIGLCRPREFMSNVHADSWDSVQIHKDVRARKSIGMHWGTVRGGLSAQYEDVRDPPRHWRLAAEEAGLIWGEDVALMDVGETVVVRVERK